MTLHQRMQLFPHKFWPTLTKVLVLTVACGIHAHSEKQNHPDFFGKRDGWLNMFLP